MIPRHQCDVKYALERKGSPYSLVLTKTNGSFERAVKRFQADLNEQAVHRRQLHSSILADCRVIWELLVVHRSTGLGVSWAVVRPPH